MSPRHDPLLWPRTGYKIWRDISSHHWTWSWGRDDWRCLGGRDGFGSIWYPRILKERLLISWYSLSSSPQLKQYFKWNLASAFKKSCLPFSQHLNYSFKYPQLESVMFSASEAQLCYRNHFPSKSPWGLSAFSEVKLLLSLSLLFLKARD